MSIYIYIWCMYDITHIYIYDICTMYISFVYTHICVYIVYIYICIKFSLYKSAYLFLDIDYAYMNIYCIYDICISI